MLDDYEVSFVLNTGIWLVSLDCLNPLIVRKKSVTENVVADVLGQEHLHHCMPSSDRLKKY